MGNYLDWVALSFTTANEKLSGIDTVWKAKLNCADGVLLKKERIEEKAFFPQVHYKQGKRIDSIDVRLENTSILEFASGHVGNKPNSKFHSLPRASVSGEDVIERRRRENAHRVSRPPWQRFHIRLYYVSR